MMPFIYLPDEDHDFPMQNVRALHERKGRTYRHPPAGYRGEYQQGRITIRNLQVKGRRTTSVAQLLNH